MQLFSAFTNAVMPGETMNYYVSPNAKSRCRIVLLLLSFSLLVQFASPSKAKAIDLTFSITGTVTSEGQPLEGVTITSAALGTTLTDASGEYRFDNAGILNIYSLTASKEGFSFSPEHRTGISVGSTVADFEAEAAQTHSVSGRVTVGALGLLGAVVDAGPLGTVVTDLLGNYRFDNVPHDTELNISVLHPGTAFDVKERVLHVVKDIVLDFPGEKKRHRLFGRVLLGTQGLSLVEINAGTNGIVFSDDDGRFELTDILHDTEVRLEVSKQDYLITPSVSVMTVADDTEVTLIALREEQDDDDDDDGDEDEDEDDDEGDDDNDAATYSVSGKLRFSNLRQAPAAGIVLKIGNVTTVSLNDGSYSFENLAAGSYEIESADGTANFIADGGVLTNARAVAVSDSDLGNVDIFIKPAIGSPLFTFWNGFIDLVNIMEITNQGNDSLLVELELFDIEGIQRDKRMFAVPAFEQRDIIVNDLQGFAKDSYGFVRVNFSHSSFTGRTAFYKYGQNTDSVQFSYAVPFTNSLRGRSWSAFNTYQPSQQAESANHLVANWLTIVNLDNRPHRYEIVRYDQNGTELLRRTVQVAAWGRSDIEGGHEFPGRDVVGLNEIIPDDENAPYASFSTRFGYGADNADEDTPFEFALPLVSRAVAERDSYLPLLKRERSLNWVEVVNISDKQNFVRAKVYGADGTLAMEGTLSLAPKAQGHFNASDLLGEEPFGYVHIESSVPKGVDAQSMFYFQSDSGQLLGLTGTQSDEPFGRNYSGSYNLYLGMENWLAISNIAESAETLTVGATHVDGSVREITLGLSAHETIWLPLHLLTNLGLQPNSYGPVFVKSNNNGNLLSKVYRFRRDANDDIEFALVTLVK